MLNEDLNNDDKDLPVRVHPSTPRRGLRESLSKLSVSSSPVMLEELKFLQAAHKCHSPRDYEIHLNDEEDKQLVRNRPQTEDESKENQREQVIQDSIFSPSEQQNKCISFKESVTTKMGVNEKDNPSLGINTCCFPFRSQCQQNCLHKQIKRVLEMEDFTVEEGFPGLSPIMEKKLLKQQQSEIVREAMMEYQHTQEQNTISRQSYDYPCPQSDVSHEGQDGQQIAFEGKNEIPVKRNKNLRFSLGRGNSLDEDILKQISPKSVHRNIQSLKEEVNMRRDKDIQFYGQNENKKCYDTEVQSSEIVYLTGSNQESYYNDLCGDRNQQGLLSKNCQIRVDKIISSTGNQMIKNEQREHDSIQNNIQSEEQHNEQMDSLGKRLERGYHLNVCPVKVQEEKEENNQVINNQVINYKQESQLQDIRRKSQQQNLSYQANEYAEQEEDEIKNQIFNSNFDMLSNNKEFDLREDANQGLSEDYEWQSSPSNFRDQLISKKYGKDACFSQFKPYQKQDFTECTTIPIIESQEEDDSEDDQQNKSQYWQKVSKNSRNYQNDVSGRENYDHQQADVSKTIVQETNDNNCRNLINMITIQDHLISIPNNLVENNNCNCASYSLICEQLDPRTLDAAQKLKELPHLSQDDLYQDKTSKKFTKDYFSNLSPIPSYEPFTLQAQALLELRDPSQVISSPVEEKIRTEINNYCGKNEKMVEKTSENREDLFRNYVKNGTATNQEKQIVSKEYSLPLQQLDSCLNSSFPTCSSLQVPSHVEQSLIHRIQVTQTSISNAQTSNSQQIFSHNNNNFYKNITYFSPKQQEQQYPSYSSKV